MDFRSAEMKIQGEMQNAKFFRVDVMVVNVVAGTPVLVFQKLLLNNVVNIVIATVEIQK